VGPIHGFGSSGLSALFFEEGFYDYFETGQ